MRHVVLMETHISHTTKSTIFYLFYSRIRGDVRTELFNLLKKENFRILTNKFPMILNTRPFTYINCIRSNSSKMNCNYYRILCFPTRIYCGDNQSLWNKLKTCGYFHQTHKTRKRTTTVPGFITILSLIQSLSNKISAHSAKRILFFFYFPFQRNIAI